MFLHNTLTKRKEKFVPIDEKNVRMYVCGPTVYDRAHLGNAKSAVVFDVLNRILREVYGQKNVTYVSNITDIDDKILNKHKETGKPIAEITTETYNWYLEDMHALNVKDPDFRPKATEFVQEMIELVQTLIDNGHAYIANGHVLFDVNSMPKYGFLSGRSMKEMLAGARIEVAEYKKNPADFILWKPSESDQPGWDSPWGYGRPGWHLECSAMSSKYLGNSFDIHGGGSDLIFPHHENECAQSLCAHPNDTFANYWVHAGMLMVDGVKMSKSLGNFHTVKEIVAQYPAEALRLLFISSHYHQPFNFTFEGLKQAKQVLDKFYNALLKVKDIAISPVAPDQKVMDALTDDINTPLAIAYLHEIVNNLNKATEAAEKKKYKSVLLASAKVLGLLYQDPESWFKNPVSNAEIGAEQINSLIEERANAKKEKNWARADEIRNQLKESGILLEDTPNGTSWKRV